MKCTPSYCEGSNIAKVAFVFICPGQEEEKREKPVAGQTGKNLDILLKYLNKSCSIMFPSKCRYDYRILNLSDEIFYKGKNGRSIPLISNIRPDENVNRIVREVGDSEIVIFFSKYKYYDTVIKKIQSRLGGKKYIRVTHLGLQALNRNIKYDKSEVRLVPGQKGNTCKRIEVVAENIGKQLKDTEFKKLTDI